MPELSENPQSAPVIVVPGCCNLGIIFRVLIIVNVSFFMVAIAIERDWLSAWWRSLNWTILIEPIVLLSLLSLCGVRQLFFLQNISIWPQRMICVMLPMIVTIGVSYFFTDFLIISLINETVSYAKSLLIAGIISFVLQHYFEIRSYAYSPALMEAKLQALQARIRPQFLFNSLNAILSIIRHDSHKAETTLQDLADLFRSLMRDTRQLTTLGGEIKLCQQYLAIETLRLGERLQCEFTFQNLDKNHLYHIKTPALLLQPLLENAVYYGVEPTAQVATITIKISRIMEKIRIVIRNPIHKQDTLSSGNHMALGNIRERLALLYDVEAQLVTRIVQDAKGVDAYFEVNLSFPYQLC